MDQKTYELGKQHYWEGIEVTAMNNAAPEAAIEWLSGWLDAQLEDKIIKGLSKQCKITNGTNRNACRL